MKRSSPALRRRTNEERTNERRRRRRTKRGGGGGGCREVTGGCIVPRIVCPIVWHHGPITADKTALAQSRVSLVYFFFVYMCVCALISCTWTCWRADAGERGVAWKKNNTYTHQTAFIALRGKSRAKRSVDCLALDFLWMYVLQRNLARFRKINYE